MEWVAAAEEFIGKYGWGARGHNLGISRMFGTSDTFSRGENVSLTRNSMVVARRPRGLLSGFLAVVPGGSVVYIPPIAAKVPPMRLRLRISDELRTEGVVFSAYLTRETPRRLVLEDVLVWRGEPVWKVKSFSHRWNNLMAEFINHHFRSDIDLQECEVSLAVYQDPQTVLEPSEREVLEFIPDTAGSKRLIWMPPRSSVLPVTVSSNDSTPAPLNYTIRKEAGMGPDVYAIYNNNMRLGLALVRTLAISKALRLAASKTAEPVTVLAEYNKTFDKYEVLQVV